MFKMAAKKNNNAKKPVSNKKNTGNAVSSAKAEEFISLFTLVGGILLGVFLYFPEGFVGSFIKTLPPVCLAGRFTLRRFCSL